MLPRETELTVTMGTPVDLPSFNLSKFMNIANENETQALLSQIRNESILVENRPVQETERAASVSPQPGPSNSSITVHIEHQPGIEDGDYQVSMEDLQPELIVRVKDPYSRFRYESEKSKERKRQRHYDVDDPDKQCLLEIQVKNLNGTAKVVAHCVDSDGVLHPFHLYGPNCLHGVYVKRFKFRPDKIHRLNGVSVIMPTSKNTKSFTEGKLKYLTECGLDEKPPNEKLNQDKQMVYVMVYVMIEDSGDVLQSRSSALCNRKQGKEFLIDTVSPPSAPACGPKPGNASSNQVLIVVSNHTLFPAEPGVVLREKDKQGNVVWERVVKEDLDVIKKAVVKFTPPAYRNPNIRQNVEVEMTLVDLKTGVETAPTIFTYQGSDEYGMDNKSRKRKLMEEDAYKYPQTNLPGQRNPDLNRQVLPSMRKNNKVQCIDSTESSSVAGAPVTQSSGPVYSQQMSVDGDHPLVNASQQAQPIRAQSQMQNPASTQLPFTSYTALQTSSQQQYDQLAGAKLQQDRRSSSGFGQVTTTTTTLIAPENAAGVQNTAGTVNTSFPSAVSGPSANQTGFPVTIQQMPQPNLFSVNQQPQQNNLQMAIINGQLYFVNDDSADQGAVSVPSTQPVTMPAATSGVDVAQPITAMSTVVQEESHVVQAQEVPAVQSQNLASQTASLSSANLRQLVANMTPEQVTAVMTGLLFQQQQQQQQIIQQQAQIVQQPAVSVALSQGYDQQTQNEAGYSNGESGSGNTSYDDLNDDDVEVDGAVSSENVSSQDSFKKPQGKPDKRLRRSFSQDKKFDGTDLAGSEAMVVSNNEVSLANIPVCVTESGKGKGRKVVNGSNNTSGNVRSLRGGKGTNAGQKSGGKR